jgi:hypothetical protein
MFFIMYTDDIVAFVVNAKVILTRLKIYFSIKQGSIQPLDYYFEGGKIKIRLLPNGRKSS